MNEPISVFLPHADPHEVGNFGVLLQDAHDDTLPEDGRQRRHPDVEGLVLDPQPEDPNLINRRLLYGHVCVVLHARRQGLVRRPRQTRRLVQHAIYAGADEASLLGRLDVDVARLSGDSVDQQTQEEPVYGDFFFRGRVVRKGWLRCHLPFLEGSARQTRRHRVEFGDVHGRG